MLYYSTKNKHNTATLEQAVTRGVAPDGGLYLPQRLPRLPKAFLRNMGAMTLQEVAYAVASFALKGDVPADVLHDIVFDAVPWTHDGLQGRGYQFHGPTA